MSVSGNASSTPIPCKASPACDFSISLEVRGFRWVALPRPFTPDFDKGPALTRAGPFQFWAISVYALERLSPRVTTDNRQHFAGDIARAGGRRQEHEGRRDLFGLSRPLHRGRAAERGDALGRLVGRIE